jgi:Sugar kinases, ribokinase family
MFSRIEIIPNHGGVKKMDQCIDNKDLDVYLYGMTVLSTIHLLAGPYPASDSYQEIKETYILPGGETGNSAIILAKLGCKVKMDGPFLGEETQTEILDFFSRVNIDCSGLHFDPTFPGVQDLVLVDKSSRTVFGKFGQYFSEPKRWSDPDKSAIRAAKIVSLDPFFTEESTWVAKYCRTFGKNYVTIDCPPESEIHKNASATIISNEFIQNKFPKTDIGDLMTAYTANSSGLVIFTFGSREILYARSGEATKKVIPFKVDVKSTLGAGDTFRAGVVYGILNEMDDQKIVKFAAATAASVCARFPMATNPPGLTEIMNIMENNS